MNACMDAWMDGWMDGWMDAYMDRCKAKCFAFAWCLAAEVVLRDIWDTPECRLITDWNAYVVESTNTFQNNQWGGTQSIDGENYQTYCNGGSTPCSSSNV